MRLTKTKAMFEMILIITSIFTIYLIAESRPVVAQGSGCCEKLGNNYCVPGSQDQCDQSSGLLFVPGVGSCADTGICTLGTCFIDNQCYANYPKSKCEHLGGQWSEKTMDKVPECSPGCCMVGDNCKFSTKSKCESLTPDDLSLNFLTGISTEQACTNECIKGDKGCCVYGGNEKIYSYFTREQCSNLGGEFQLNTYCSSMPESGCKTGNHTGCLDNDPSHLYSFDSCGNMEGIKQDCNYPSEVCAKDINDQNSNGNKEEFVCRTSDCQNTYDNPLIDNDGGTRKNDEAWCEYPSATGPGLDLPGSIHSKHYCIDGVEYAVNCGGDRDEICVYGKYTNTGELNESNFLYGLPDMSFASCIPNRAEDCYQQKKVEDCLNMEERDCIWTANETKKEKGNLCVPLVPPGFTKEERDGEEAIAEDLCKKGNVKMDVLWEAYLEADGGWKWHCKENCDAFDGKTLKSTNFYCMMQGDCGASPNIANEFSEEGYSRLCRTGMPSGNKIKPKCIAQFTENLWHKYYDEFTFKYKGRGLDLGSVDAENYQTEAILGLISPFLGGIGLASYVLVKLWDDEKDAIIAGAVAGAVIGTMIFPGVGTVIGAMIGAVISASIAELLEKQTIEELEIKCKPWDIPDGGEDCWKCSAAVSKGGLLPDKNGEILENYMCQPYTCDTLGKLCKHLPDALEGPTCIAQECHDINPPIIIPYKIVLGTGNLKCCTDESEQKDCNPIDCTINDKGANIGYDISQDVNEFKTFTFGIETVDESGNPLYTTCAYSDDPVTTISEEGELVSGMSLMDGLSDGKSSTHHNITIPAGHLASLGESQAAFYLRCKTADIEGCGEGVESPVDYIIKFKIHTGPDTTTPIIEYIEPEPAYLAYDKNEKDVTVRVNEVLTWNSVLQSTGGCRWSDQNIAYDLMSPDNNLLCSDPGIYQQQECSVKLTELKQGTNMVYFACSDPAGNNMTQSYQYTLIRTSSLNITSFQPVSIDCIYGSIIDCYTNNLSLKAETVGGAESGKASCTWSNRCDTCTGIPFFKTDSTMHEQPNLQFFVTQDYTYYTTCTDIAENEARSSLTFKINVDNDAPKIVGISHDLQYDKLKITIEDANAVKCEYSDKEFYLPEGKPMSNIGNSYFADWGLGLYYIRCEDKFGNEMPLSIIHISSI